jgi:hypothetical protein
MNNVTHTCTGYVRTCNKVQDITVPCTKRHLAVCCARWWDQDSAVLAYSVSHQSLPSSRFQSTWLNLFFANDRHDSSEAISKGIAILCNRWTPCNYANFNLRPLYPKKTPARPRNFSIIGPPFPCVGINCLIPPSFWSVIMHVTSTLDG